MDAHRIEIERALKEYFVPELRNLGFKGSFPHFRRVVSPYLQLLSFQFFSSGGSFVVEISYCYENGFTTSWNKFIPANKMRVSYVSPRLRLGSQPDRGINDHWYEFGPRSYEDSREIQPMNYYKDIVLKVLNDFHKQALDWWNNNLK